MAKKKKKKKAGAALATFTVTVAPGNIVPAGSNNVECDFNGPTVTDNALFLSLNTAYDITFNLEDGTEYTFDPAKPFCNKKMRCPPELPKGSVQKPFTITTKDSDSIKVHVDPVPSRKVTHFRLNFNDGYSCDPIIINN